MLKLSCSLCFLVERLIHLLLNVNWRYLSHSRSLYGNSNQDKWTEWDPFWKSRCSVLSLPSTMNLTCWHEKWVPSRESPDKCLYNLTINKAICDCLRSRGIKVNTFTAKSGDFINIFPSPQFFKTFHFCIRELISAWSQERLFVLYTFLIKGSGGYFHKISVI